MLLLALAIVGIVGFFWLRLRIDDFKQRVRAGFAVLSDRRRYLRTVAAWQAGDWLLRLVAIWFFLGAFGIEQSLQNVLLVQVTQSLATLVPISPVESEPSRPSSSTSSEEPWRAVPSSPSRSG